MPDAPPPPLPDAHAPDRPEGGVATRLASQVSATGFGVDPDADGTSGSWWRLGLVLGALALLGYANPWMLVVVLGLIVIIALHELGHYVMAKRAGMKVTEYFLGFGPRIWSTRRGETEYGIKLIPAGAYVKIPGMVNLDEVAPEDEARTYRQKPFWDRIGVAVAGSAMHFLIALVLIYISLVFVGEPNGALTTDVGTRPAVVEEVVDGSGASAAGLQPGDEIIAIDGEPIPDVRALTQTVAPRRGTTVPVAFVRDGDELSADVDLQAYTYEADDGSTRKACGLGIVMADAPEERVGPVQGLVEAPKQFVEIVRLSVRGLASFFSPSGITDFAQQVGSAGEDRADLEDARDEVKEDPCTTAGSSSSGGSNGENRVVSIYGIARLGSEVGGFEPTALIGMFALFNIFIGVFNLTPLLPFDGGHVSIAVYEKIQERRLHKRRYFADVSRLLPLTYVVVVMMAMLFFSSLYLDVVNPIGG